MRNKMIHDELHMCTNIKKKTLDLMLNFIQSQTFKQNSYKLV